MSVRIITGDALTVLRTLESESVQVCVTSPPYYGLRSYGTNPQVWDGDPEHAHDWTGDGHKITQPTLSANSTLKGSAGAHREPKQFAAGAFCPCGAWRGELGSEPSPALFIEHLVTIFDEVRRVLRADGTCWVNLGSSYAGSGKGPTGKNGLGDQAKRQGFVGAAATSDQSQSRERGRAPACDTDGRARSDSHPPDSAYSGLCDGCLADFLSHRDRTAGMPPQQRLDGLPPSLTDRDSAHRDSVLVLPADAALGAQASTTLESWLLSRGECSRCDSRAASFVRVGLLPSGHAVQRCAHTTGVPSAARSTSDATRGQHGSNGGTNGTDGASAHRTGGTGADSASYQYFSTLDRHRQSKSLILIPEMFALAMEEHGWWVRSRIAWCKTSAMPESVRDRPTSAWEHVWMFTRSARYFYDAEAVKVPAMQPVGVPRLTGSQAKTTAGGWTTNGTGNSTLGTNQGPSTANLRNFWLLGPEPSSLEHYAGFPTEIPRRCILAGSRRGDVVLDPFLGSGTTALVADRLQRAAIGIELSPTYADMARRRLEADAGPMFADKIEADAQPPMAQALGLFADVEVST